MANSGDHYREMNRNRLKRYYDKQKALGRQRATVLLSADTFLILNKEKERTGTTISSLVEQALIQRFKEPTIKSEPQYDSVFKATGYGDFNGIHDCHGKEFTVPERDELLIQLNSAYPGRKNSKTRVNLLNNAGVSCGRSTKTKWTPAIFSRFLRLAKIRQKK